MTKILTDSSAYLKRREADEMGISIAPMAYSAEDGSMFMERFVDENVAFDRLLHKKGMHTSQVTYASFHNAFQGLMEGAENVLCVTMSARFSGTYANAKMAAERAGRGIQVIDSKTAAAGLFLLVKKAHQLMEKGMKFPALSEELNAFRGRIRTFFSVDDMKPLRDSGRLGNVKLSVSTILNIRPILKIENGGIAFQAMARGKIEQLSCLSTLVPQSATDIIVQHNHAPSKAEQLAQRLKAAGFNPAIRSVGPVLAIHLGEGAIGVSFVEG